MTYKLDERKAAIVHAAADRHICSDLHAVKRGRKSAFTVPVDLNEVIQNTCVKVKMFCFLLLTCTSEMIFFLKSDCLHKDHAHKGLWVN